jgi:hypothetical protein
MQRSIPLFLTCLLAATFLAAAPTTPPADIVFSEDFEQFDAKRWNTIKGPRTVEIVEGGHRGGKCAQVTATLGENEGGYLYKMLQPGLDVMHLRFYVKFEKEHEYIHHFVKIVGYNPPTRWPQGRAGERPSGSDFFSTGIEPWGNWGKFSPPGVWHFYTYYPDMKASPDGKFWGNGFNPDPPVPVERDKWICVEISSSATRRRGPMVSRRCGSTGNWPGSGRGCAGGRRRSSMPMESR